MISVIPIPDPLLLPSTDGTPTPDTLCLRRVSLPGNCGVIDRVSSIRGVSIPYVYTTHGNRREVLYVIGRVIILSLVFFLHTSNLGVDHTVTDVFRVFMTTRTVDMSY